MDDYIFENGSKMINPQPDDPNYTFENGTKPELPNKAGTRTNHPESLNFKEILGC